MTPDSTPTSAFGSQIKAPTQTNRESVHLTRERESLTTDSDERLIWAEGSCSSVSRSFVQSLGFANYLGCL